MTIDADPSGDPPPAPGQPQPLTVGDVLPIILATIDEDRPTDGHSFLHGLRRRWPRHLPLSVDDRALGLGWYRDLEATGTLPAHIAPTGDMGELVALN